MTDYFMWTKERLPDDIPEKAIKKASFNISWYRIDGTKVIELGDRGRITVAYQAEDENDLKIWCAKKVCEAVASEWELFDRNNNLKKWRFIDEYEENNVIYYENKHYQYNAIYNARLDSFEKYLILIKPFISAQDWENEVNHRISLINLWFNTPHWNYDKKAMRFIEISDSKEHNSDDTEIPAPDSVIKYK